jgi:hypothetical protein
MAVDVQTNGPDSSDVVAPDVPGTPIGSPTSATPQVGGPAQQPQPAAPPKETIGQGLARGASGEKYFVDGQGNMVSARATSTSPAGTFGGILSGVVMGALAGAKSARPGRIPSSEVGGGFGAGVASAEADAQQRDQRNRTQAQQDFTNRNQAQKMSREQAESAAVINHLSAQTASELGATQRANEEHPLNMALKKAGLDEASQSLQKGYQDLAKNSLDMMKTLTDSGINPSAMPTSWTDGKPHVADIVQGRSIPLHNGETGEGQGAGIFDVQQLRQTPLTKPAIFKTYTTDKDGNPVEKINTLPVGTTAFDYVTAAMAGKSQLKDILSQQAVKQATELHKATIREKNATAFKDTAEGQKASQDAALTKSLVGGGGNGAPVKLDPNTHADEEFLSSLPTSRAAMIREVGEGKAYSSRLFSGKDGELLLQQLSRAYGGQWDQSRAESYFKMRQDFTSGQTSKALNSYNTTIAHLGTMWDHVANANSISINTPGTDVHRQLEQDLQLVSTELTKAVSNGNMTEGEKKDILKSLKSYTVHGYQTNIKEATQLLHGKQESFAEQWANGAPPAAVSQVPIISKKAEATLARINGNATQPQPQPQPQQAPSAQRQPQVFNPAAWSTAHPGQDVNAAIAYAKSQGYAVKQ